MVLESARESKGSPKTETEDRKIHGEFSFMRWQEAGSDWLVLLHGSKSNACAEHKQTTLIVIYFIPLLYLGNLKCDDYIYFTHSSED